MGNKIQNLKAGLVLCQEKLHLLATSHWQITKPLFHKDYDISHHDSYINFVVDVSSELAPLDCLAFTRSIEQKIGHSDHGKWLPRHLDIDIILGAKNFHRKFSLCQTVTMVNPNLTIPHPEYLQRDFLIEMIEDDLGIQTKNHFTQRKAIEC